MDLFHAKRSRKLSLRFLASYLLKANIQTHTHDSIEDACTALRLYEARGPAPAPAPTYLLLSVGVTPVCVPMGGRGLCQGLAEG